MRGNKRRASAPTTAANAPAVNDAILDVVNRKGMRCCVECGATSTPQWREGPMGPKTLCNACGVRRQRLLRKQQAAAVGTVPTAPVAAVQARRRTMGRAALQHGPNVDADETPFALVSGSEQSSDETEVVWASATPTKRHQPTPVQHRHHPVRHSALQPVMPQPEVEESCNEDESAAYDLLFFAGVECGNAGNDCGDAGNECGNAGNECDPDRQMMQHGHNTRRHAHPVRRLDDFYYFYEDEASGLDSGDKEELVGGDGPGGCKRRRVLAPPPSSHTVALAQARPWLAASPLSSATEDMDDSAPVTEPRKATEANGHAKDPHHPEQQRQGQLPAGKPVGTPGPDSLTPSSTAAGDLGGHFSPLPSAAVPMPTPAGAPPAAAAASSPLVPMLTLPMVTLPVLPLSLPVPTLSTMSTEQYQALAKLSLEFQRACLQLHHANVACEAIGAVVADRRQAATSAHHEAVSASRQLAAEARGLVERHPAVRDVLSELHSVTAAESAGVAPSAAAAEGSAATARDVPTEGQQHVKQEDQSAAPEGEQQQQ